MKNIYLKKEITSINNHKYRVFITHKEHMSFKLFEFPMFSEKHNYEVCYQRYYKIFWKFGFWGFANNYDGFIHHKYDNVKNIYSEMINELSNK